jgi:outer membrane protein assembly factor BamD
LFIKVQRGMKKKSFFWCVLMVIILFAFLLACAGKGGKRMEGDPQILYREGLVRFNKRDYSEALKRFEQLKSNFPDSPPYTIWAELKIGDCHFFRKEYVEAIAAYEEFRKIHPTHEEMPYVQYQIGMSYFNQMLSLDRDQTFAQKALSSFEYLAANYPPSLFTEKTKEKIEICRKRLADHEFYVGNYYYKRDRFDAASYRFQGLLEKYPKMPDEDRTLFLLGKSYLELNEGEKARGIFNRLIKEYPKSDYYEQAKKMIEQGINEKEVAASEKKKKNEEGMSDAIPLIKFEEEKRKAVFFDSSPPVVQNPVGSNPHPRAESKVQAAEEARKRVPPNPLNPSNEKEKKGERSSQDSGQENRVNAGEPIDITSDRVETYSKENLFVFRGNVVARQKDIVIYADSIEAVMIGEGKGIERVIATGNVRIQQGPRVASCRKAVFYNADHKIVLTGDPKVQEGEDLVSGDEIIFNLAQNRVEVKGGTGGRGKAKIRPGGKLEK